MLGAVGKRKKFEFHHLHDFNAAFGIYMYTKAASLISTSFLFQSLLQNIQAGYQLM